jgi:hypothetical protein
MKTSTLVSVCTVAVAAMFAVLASAQQSSVIIRTAMPDMDRMAVLLDLTEYQKNEVVRILDEQRQELTANVNVAATGEEMSELWRQVREETRLKLQMVLTELQLEKFDLLEQTPAGQPRRAIVRSAGEDGDQERMAVRLESGEAGNDGAQRVRILRAQ